MREIDAEIYPAAARLFAGIRHNIPVVYSVLEGNSPGRVFVDDAAAPRLGLIYPQDAYVYLAGDPRSPALDGLPALLFDEILPAMAEKELVLFAFSDNLFAALEGLLRPKEMKRIWRKTFRFMPERFASLPDWRERVPEGFALRPVDDELAAREPAYRPLVDPRTRQFGVCLLHGEVIASECTAVYVGGGQAEVDILTREDYRGRGLAAITAGAFVEECQRRGLIPNWSCWPERLASAALAHKLGFEAQPDIPALLWYEGM